MAMTLPQVNTQGNYDVLGNAMSRGIGGMYAIQEAQATGRDQDQNYLSALNKYDNDLLDNPLKQAKRENELSQQGILKGMFADGTNRDLAYSAAETKKQTDLGEQGKSKTGPQMELAAQQTAQFINDMEAIEQAGGGLPKQQYWDSKVAPMLQKMGVPYDGNGPTESNMQKFGKLNEFLQTQTANSKTMAIHSADNASRERIAEINGRARINSKTDRPETMDQTVAMIAQKAMAGEQITSAEESILNAWKQKQTATTATAEGKDIGVQALEIQKFGLLNRATKETNPARKEELTKAIGELQIQIEEAKRSVSPGTRTSEPQPKAEPTDALSENIKKMGGLKSTDDLKNLRVGPKDVGATVNINGKRYKLSAQGMWDPIK